MLGTALRVLLMLLKPRSPGGLGEFESCGGTGLKNIYIYLGNLNGTLKTSVYVFPSFCRILTLCYQ